MWNMFVSMSKIFINNLQNNFPKSKSSRRRGRKAESFKCMYIANTFAILCFFSFFYQAYFLCVCVCKSVVFIGWKQLQFTCKFVHLPLCGKCRVLMHVIYMYTLNACYVPSHYGWKNLISIVKKMYML